MNWLYRIFNWRKSPKTTNEMHSTDVSKNITLTAYINSIDTSKYDVGVDYFEDIIYKNKKELNTFIVNSYFKVTKIWHKCAKNYYVWGLDSGELELNKYSSPNGIDKFYGNLYILYKELIK